MNEVYSLNYIINSAKSRLTQLGRDNSAIQNVTDSQMAMNFECSMIKSNSFIQPVIETINNLKKIC